MIYKAYEAKYKERLFRIEESFPEIGAYLYIYEKDGYCSHDYLQNNTFLCKEFANEMFNVPLSNWEFKEEITHN